MSELINNLKKEYKERQEKLIYYLMALDVSSIGCAIYNGKNDELNYAQIFVFIAILCWAISILNAFKFIKKYLNAIYDNISFLELEKVNNIEIWKEEFEKIIKEKYKITGTFFENIWLHFVAGSISYFLYHLLNLYLNSV
ncbi:MAG: hypothetical protein ACK4HC_09390 [Cloacibacterium sp.]